MERKEIKKQKRKRYCDWYEEMTGNDKQEHITKVIFDMLNNAREKCEYCERKKSFEVKPTTFLQNKGRYDKFEVFIYKGEADEVAGLMIGNYEGFRYIDINYCPMCGRRL